MTELTGGSTGRSQTGQDWRGILGLIWGEGWPLPGGPQRIDSLFGDLDLRGKQVLVLGRGSAAIAFYLVERHHAGRVTGLDVDATAVAKAQAKAQALGLDDRLTFLEAGAGVLPFAADQFDFVYNGNGLGLGPTAGGLISESFRVLRSGGTFLASDLLVDEAGEGSADAGLAQHLGANGSSESYRGLLRDAGFTDALLANQNDWYVQVARNELASMKGPIYDEAAKAYGKEYIDRAVEIWEAKLAVLERGGAQLTNIRARRP